MIVHRRIPPLVRVVTALAMSVAILQGCSVTTDVKTGIYVAEPVADTPGLIAATSGAPNWSPNGEAIAWANEDGLHVSSLAGGEVRTLSTSAVAGRPAWSPDGRSLAFVDHVGSALVTIDVASGETLFATALSTDDARYRPVATPTFGGPTWSPDGSLLAFNCWDGAGDEVCVIAADGTKVNQVTRIEPVGGTRDGSNDGYVPASANVGPPSWSPDGLSLAVAAYPERRGAAAGVFIVELERGVARRISSLVPNSEIVWFPDGELVLFTATEKGRSDAWRVRLDGSSPENVTRGLADGARQPALTADGSRIAIASGGAIIVQDLNGDVAVTISSSLWNASPAWHPGGRAIAFTSGLNPLASYV